MNRVFKTKWSVAHQEYVVTDEQHASKGKASKSAVALAVAALMMAAGAASAAYKDPGFVANTHFDVLNATHSWETAEYEKDWGLRAMNSSKAYALGFNGKGTMVGVMDSGALLHKHPELSGNRFFATHYKGEYGSSGNRYPHNGNPASGKYEQGGKFEFGGEWIPYTNDYHGTHVLGTVGANRDGTEFHGVAWGADILSGNTGGTDATNYGPYQDYDLFKAAWDASVKELTKANGKIGETERGGVINNSWGTNIKITKIYKLTKQKDGSLDWEFHHNLKPGEKIDLVPQDKMDVEGSFTSSTSGIDVTNLQEAEYEYFYHRQEYADKYKGTDHEGKSFVDAAFHAVKDKNVVQIFTTGNQNRNNPFYRPLYPYFNPAAEKHWIAVTGLGRNSKTGKYDYLSWTNRAGLAKWWTVAAPSGGIYSSKVDINPDSPTFGQPQYYSASGTSMGAPHVAGAMAVLMSRYPSMNALQVRDVMFTTAHHNNPDGTPIENWKNQDGSKVGEGQVSDIVGWGIPDLDKGMYGPGQFLGKFEYDMSNAELDVWSNDITNVALDQRRDEDKAWLDNYQTNLDKDDYVLGDQFVVIDGDKDDESHVIKKKDNAKEWRKQYYELRKTAIEAKQDHGKNTGYMGTLVKKGAGTLVMTGTNSYKGDTTVEGGTLLAFAESIGNKKVTVNGGTFGVLSSYDDQFTKKGVLTSKNATTNELEITIGEKGTLFIDAASTVKVKKVEFQGAKKIEVGLAGADRKALLAAYKGEKQVTGSIESQEGTGVFDGLTSSTADSKQAAAGTATKPTVNVVDSASDFFKIDGYKGEGNKFTVSLSRDKDVTFATFAKGANQVSIAKAIEASENDLMLDLITQKKETIQSVYGVLDDDFYVTVRNGLVMNATAMSRAVVDQAQGIGNGRSAEFDEGRAHVWAAGMGLWGTADGNTSSVDNDFGLGMVGAEFNVCQATKLGAFFGYGTTKLNGEQSKVDADDTHYGVYGLTDYGNASFTYGIAYTDQDRDTVRNLGGEVNTHSENASVLQAFAEAGYNFDVAAAKVTPYAGLSWVRVESDDVVDKYAGHDFKTNGNKDNIQIATLGVRAALPFNWGTFPITVKADAGWSHFFGDNAGAAQVQMGAKGKFATIEGSELKDQFNLGFGVAGQLGKNATVGVNYVGAWGSDIDSHGLTANLRFNF